MKVFFQQNLARPLRKSNGFTLLEVIIALGLFVFAYFAFEKSGSMSTRAVRESESLFQATQVARNKMFELEEKYQKQIDRDGVKDQPMGEESGSFEKPNDMFSWEAKLIPSTMKLSEASIRAVLESFGLEKEDIDAQLENPAQRIVYANINKAIKENYAELVLLVKWEQFGRKRTLPLVTHLILTKPKITLTQNADDFDEGPETSSASSSASSAEVNP